MDIYRLNVSLAANRRTSTILEILDKGKATPQDIQPGDFLHAFDNLLCPFTPGNATLSGYCDPGQARYVVTANLWNIIYMSYTPEALESSVAVDTLRNLYATALFLYNPVFSSSLPFNGPVFSRQVQDGLADENYFPGSAARHSSYIAPATWTVLVFTVLAGLLIVASFGAIFFGLWFKPPESSAFGLLDTFKIEVVQHAGTAGSVDLATLARLGNDREVVRVADGLRIKLKQG
ncbi:hypothetical protein ACRE_024720 [Hapsidospora chrysogenum ATCC 11550]|uniref:Uncharacterized protein n=1 Tax=Hapsidospora chrysogenum (strain ATCC 11550 / CBS 779.69 / DSM 880 / IAM 14645 / JCM 23072 / IMI 49137) TaxID=857340 RepID=A0A086TBF8_HAPC1|nr:hypothetical protein ACRE_024720 [Hapsidospora chrysogenum ATCC 11550]